VGLFYTAPEPTRFLPTGLSDTKRDTSL